MTKRQKFWIGCRHLEANRLGWSIYNSQPPCSVVLPYEKVLAKRLERLLK